MTRNPVTVLYFCAFWVALGGGAALCCQLESEAQPLVLSTDSEQTQVVVLQHRVDVLEMRVRTVEALLISSMSTSQGTTRGDL